MSLVNVNGTLFFSADDGVKGRELWKRKGTGGGTALVANINPGAASSDPTFLTAAGSNLFFRANNGTNGNELWTLRNPVAAALPPARMIAPDSNDPNSLSPQNSIGDSRIKGRTLQYPADLYFAGFGVQSAKPDSLFATNPKRPLAARSMQVEQSESRISLDLSRLARRWDDIATPTGSHYPHGTNNDSSQVQTLDEIFAAANVSSIFEEFFVMHG